MYGALGGVVVPFFFRCLGTPLGQPLLFFTGGLSGSTLVGGLVGVGSDFSTSAKIFLVSFGLYLVVLNPVLSSPDAVKQD